MLQDILNEPPVRCQSILCKVGTQFYPLCPFLFGINSLVEGFSAGFNKEEFTSFYIRQTLGLMLLSLLTGVKFLTYIVGVVMLILWIISLVGAIQGQEKPLPVIGEYFQQWFGGL